MSLKSIGAIAVISIAGIVSFFAVFATIYSDGLSNIRCYSSGYQFYEADNVQVWRVDDNTYQVRGGDGAATVSGDCTVFDK